MAEPVLHANVSMLVSSSLVLARYTEELDAELSRIAARWSDLRASWSGVAASRYEPSWEDWHNSARTVTSVLSETAKFLATAANAYAEQERCNTEQVDDVHRDAESM